MVALMLVSILLVGISVFFGWALWHLIYDERHIPRPSATVQHVTLDDSAPSDHPTFPRETPSTPQLHLPPTVMPFRQSQERLFLSGMGSNWNFLHNVVSPVHHRRLRHD